MINEKKVIAILDQTLKYAVPPGHPPEIFPELVNLGYTYTDPTNSVYSSIREIFARLGLDRSRFGTKSWNPFGEFIRPGDIVVIKPNLVFHERTNLKGTYAITTHSSVLRPIVDYALLALRGKGKCIICDSPLQSADLDSIMLETGLQNLLEFYREKGFPVEFYDLRTERVIMDKWGFFSKKIAQRGDPLGYIEIDLDGNSALEPITRQNTFFGVSDYNPEVTYSNHQKGQHRYLISRTVLIADVFINVPKLKTHQKAGITVCLKNLIGINGRKDYLPHFRIGNPTHGGDEFPVNYDLLYYLHSRIRAYLQGKNRLLFIVFKLIWEMMKQILGISTNSIDQGKKVLLTGGSWWGNDTLWRTIVDLNRILFYCDKEGQIKTRRQRKYFAVVDGIVAGEGNGPIEPIPKQAGVLLAGFNPLALDIIASLVMGFEPSKIPLILHGGAFLDDFACKISELEIEAKVGKKWQILQAEGIPSLNFLSPPGWKGFIEKI